MGDRRFRRDLCEGSGSRGSQRGGSSTQDGRMGGEEAGGRALFADGYRSGGEQGVADAGVGVSGSGAVEYAGCDY